MNSIKTALNDELLSEIEELKNAPLGTEDYKTTVDGIAKLMDRAIELKKIDIEQREKDTDRETETELKIAQLEDDRKDRFVKNLLTAAGLVVTTGITIWGTLATFKFEEEGTVTSMIGKSFINKILPKK